MANNLLVPNVYYTAEQYVDPVLYSTPQNALVDQKLIYPLLKDAGNYQVAVAKAEIPLDTIPLTKYNIPLKRYEVILRNGEYEASAYLRQLNSSSKDFLWNCTPDGVVNLYYYTTTGSLQLVGSTDCSSFVPNGVFFFCVDDFRNAYFATPSVLGGLVNQVIVVNLTTSTQLTSLEATLIQGMDLDRGNKLYLADEEVDGSVVKVYQNQNSSSEVNLNLIQTITTDYQGNPLSGIRTISADQTLLVGYDVNKFSIYNITTFQAYTGFTNSGINHMGRASALNSSGEGTFVVVDDGEIDELFLGSKSTAPPNLYNMNTDVAFGEPSITLTGDWLSSAKFGITTNGFCFGIGSNNQMYAFPYDYVNAVPTGQPSFVNSSFVYGSITATNTRNNLFASTTGGGLCALNLDNLPNNNVYEFDATFTLGSGGLPPVSWDYQLNSQKIIGISSQDGKIYSTTKPIYPNNFCLLSPISSSSTGAVQSLVGCGWNQSGQTQTAVQIQQATYAPSSIYILDGFQEASGDIVALASTPSSKGLIYRTTINGTLVNSFSIDQTNFYTSICRPASNVVACMQWSGDIFLYNATTGASLATITTPYSYNGNLNNPTPYICGGRVNPTLFIIIVSYGGTVAIYGSANGSTGWSQIFSQNNIIPTGGTTPMVFQSGVLYGAGNSPSPTLYLLGSGFNSSPNYQTCQSIVQFEFNANFTSLVSTTPLLDGSSFCNRNTSLTEDYNVGELYVMNGSGLNNWNGTITTYNVGANQITSTITIPNPSPGYWSPCLNVYCGGSTGYYSWTQISSSGASGFVSIACSRRNPNNLYVLDGSGICYRGTIVSGSVAFTAFPIVQTDANWGSISIAPDTIAYDSFVYEYTISNQQQVGQTIHYPAQLVSSVGRNDVSSNYSVCVKNSKIDFYNASNFTNTGSASLSNANLIFTKAGEDVDAGYADIYNFQVFVNALNGAFAEAYARLKNSGGTLTEAPVASIDFTNQLFTLNYSSDYPQTGNGIIFNPALLRIVQYYATPDTIDVGFYKLVLPPGSTSWTQTNKSAYRFNKLNKILFQSTTIYVSGSFVGINAQNQTITDVDIPTDSFIDNQGQTLYFQPNLLRPYVLGSNNPIDRVQLSVLYSYIDGTQYALTIAPDDGWSVLFDFIRKV